MNTKAMDNYLYRTGQVTPNNLRKIRKERGLNQRQVAEQLGLKGNDRISHWERGQMMPSLKNLMKLSRLYGVTIERLFPSQL